MRWLVILVLLAASPARAERDDVHSREVAAARAAKLSCAKLAVLAHEKAELERAPSLLAVAQQRCMRDRWSIEMLVCTTRTQALSWCDRRWLTLKQKQALDGALDRAGASHPDERRRRHINLAIKNGVLVERFGRLPSAGTRLRN